LACNQTEQERIDYLEKKMQTEDKVLAELTAKHCALKGRNIPFSGSPGVGSLWKSNCAAAEPDCTA
jgi:hypothetical protein